LQYTKDPAGAHCAADVGGGGKKKRPVRDIYRIIRGSIRMIHARGDLVLKAPRSSNANAVLTVGKKKPLKNPGCDRTNMVNPEVQSVPFLGGGDVKAG